MAPAPVELQYVDKQGNTVEEGSEQSAYQINPADDSAQAFIDRLKSDNAATDSAKVESATSEAAKVEAPKAAPRPKAEAHKAATKSRK